LFHFFFNVPSLGQDGVETFKAQVSFNVVEEYNLRSIVNVLEAKPIGFVEFLAVYLNDRT
jgi:hypothetical protein